MRFGTDVDRGLTADRAAANLQRYGPNELTKQKSAGPFVILARQFQSTVVVLLLVAAGVSWLWNEHIQAGARLAAVLINAAVGFITELKAKFSLEALEGLAGPIARVIRDGKEQTLAARELVPGDLVVLDAGSRVPADLVLIEAASLSIEESMLSGESIPVYKSKEKDGAGEETQLAFQGTLVLSGRARGMVIATSNDTKLGKPGLLLSQTVSIRTPLEEQLEKLGQQLTWLTIALCGLLLVVGLSKKYTFG